MLVPAGAIYRAPKLLEKQVKTILVSILHAFISDVLKAFLQQIKEKFEV